jgi:hypothetical protein
MDSCLGIKSNTRSKWVKKGFQEIVLKPWADGPKFARATATTSTAVAGQLPIINVCHPRAI